MKKVLFVMDIQEDTTGVSAKKKPFPIKNHEELIQQINKCIHSYETEVIRLYILLMLCQIIFSLDV